MLWNQLLEGFTSRSQTDNLEGFGVWFEIMTIDSPKKVGSWNTHATKTPGPQKANLTWNQFDESCN